MLRVLLRAGGWPWALSALTDISLVRQCPPARLSNGSRSSGGARPVSHSRALWRSQLAPRQCGEGEHHGADLLITAAAAAKA